MYGWEEKVGFFISQITEDEKPEHYNLLLVGDEAPSLPSTGCCLACGRALAGKSSAIGE